MSIPSASTRPSGERGAVARGAGLVAALLAASGCAPDPEAVDDRAVAEALEGTRPPAEEGPGSTEPRPLDEAEPHRAIVEGELRVETLAEGEPDRRMRTRRVIDRGPGRSYRVVDERRWTDPRVAPTGTTDGREGVYDGEHFAVRRRWGPWMRRETFSGYEERFLRRAYDVAPAVLRAFEPYIRWRKTGRRERIAGVSVRWVVAELDEAVAPRELGDETLEALRNHDNRWTGWMAGTHRPTRIEGRLARTDDGEGEVVAGRLEIAGKATAADRARRFELMLRHEVEPLPDDASFEMPDDAMPARRPRVWRTIRQVLGDSLREAYASGRR